MGHHKHKNLSNRRNFLRKMLGAGCASLTLNPFLSTVTNLGLFNAVARANQPTFSASSCSDYKALVCIMLSGGNDSFNMLVPYEQSQHDKYAALRGGVNSAQNPSGMALSRNSLRQLNTANGVEYGLNSAMSNIENLFNGTDTNDKYVSFVTNVGTLAEPLENKTNFLNTQFKKPVRIGSHYDQALAWQTGISTSDIQSGTGWMGRTTDILQSCNTYQDISMNISLNGLNVFQRGNNVKEYVIQSLGNGSIEYIDNFFHKQLFPGEDNFYYNTRLATVDSLYETNCQNVLEKAYADVMKKSLLRTDDFSAAISSFNINGNTDFSHSFPNTSIGNQLAMVAKSIGTRNELGGVGGIKRQTFFVVMGGFDTHSELIASHGLLMQELDQALYAFYRAIKELEENDSNLSNKVTGFTMSDFARTLTSNGNGTDHAWGGHHLVFGGAVNGGEILGAYPDLVDNNLNIGNGRFIPTISCDEYFAELALWFGASPSDLYDILPNIGNFWSPTSTGGPIGFMNI